MFEASFLNGIQMRCGEHPRNLVTHVCTEYKCNQNPFICIECKNCQIHYGHDLKIKDLIPAVTEISQSLTRTRKPIEIMYSKICTDNQNDTLMKYQEQREQHCQSIRKHIESIKFQIQEQIVNIVQVFKVQIQKEKQIMFKELERYYEEYRKKFEHISKKIGPIASLNKSFKYYSSKSNILLKMLADPEANVSVKWFNDLKKASKAAQTMIVNPELELEEIKSLSSKINQLMDKLPRVRSAEYESKMPLITKSSCRQALKLFVKFGEIRHIPSSSVSHVSHISRSHSVQAQSQNRVVLEDLCE